MKKAALLLTSLLIAFVTGCQDHNLEPHPEDVMAWRAGGPAGDAAQDIAVDQSGNTYVTGAFTGTATFGSTTLTSNGISDIFIVKYNNKGEVQWAHRAGGPNTNTSSVDDRGHDIAVDQSGNVYVTGYFTGTATFGTTSLTSNGSSNMFIGKYNSNGEVQWVRNAEGAGSSSGSGIAIDQSGNPYVTGGFSGTVTFGSTSLTSRGSSDVFIAKYNPSGDVLWVQQAGGTESDGASSIAVDKSGNAYITGSHEGTAVFGATTLTGTRSRVTASNMFIAKYSSAGEVLWARGGGEVGNGIAVDGSGSVYVTGTTYISVFTPEMSLLKLNTDGETQWHRYIGTMGLAERGVDIAADKSGNAYLIGTTQSSRIGIFQRTNTGGFEGVEIDQVHYGAQDIFVAKLDGNGNVQWTRSAGGTGDDVGLGIAVDEQGTAYTTGYFPGTATFGTTTLTSAGHFDVFVAKFKQ